MWFRDAAHVLLLLFLRPLTIDQPSTSPSEHDAAVREEGSKAAVRIHFVWLIRHSFFSFLFSRLTLPQAFCLTSNHHPTAMPLFAGRFVAESGFAPNRAPPDMLDSNSVVLKFTCHNVEGGYNDEMEFDLSGGKVNFISCVVSEDDKHESGFLGHVPTLSPRDNQRMRIRIHDGEGVDAKDLLPREFDATYLSLEHEFQNNYSATWVGRHFTEVGPNTGTYVSVTQATYSLDDETWVHHPTSHRMPVILVAHELKCTNLRRRSRTSSPTTLLQAAHVTPIGPPSSANERYNIR